MKICNEISSISVREGTEVGAPESCMIFFASLFDGLRTFIINYFVGFSTLNWIQNLPEKDVEELCCL